MPIDRFTWEREAPRIHRRRPRGKDVSYESIELNPDAVVIYDRRTGEIVAKVDPGYADQITRALNAGAGLVTDKPPF